MKKQLLLSLLIIISFSSISFAQISRERANEIVFKYIIDEEMRTDVLRLSTTDDLPDADGVSTITTFTSEGYESFSIEYPCWVYNIYEWMDVNCCRPYRFLFVNKETGSVLEVKTKGRPHYPGPENWQNINYNTNELSDIEGKLDNLYFPNPVNDFLEITCEKDFEYIVIFDLQGKQVFKETSKKHESVKKFNVSSLQKGIYIVNIFDATKNILSLKIIKN